MSRIAGIIHYHGRAPVPKVVAGFANELSLIAAQTWTEDPIALLATRPEGLPAAPAVQVDDDIVVVLDGWIDNAEDLARRAEASVPGGDAAALAVAWRRWGPQTAERLDGEFAAAIWERRRQRLFLLRDRHGTRPLYWTRNGARFAFSSHLPALLGLSWVGRKLRRDCVAEYLSFRTVHAPRTLVQGVHQVQSAHWLRVDRDDLATRRWWSPQYAPPGTPRPHPGDVVPALHDAVERSLKRRMRPGWRRALLLSGGLGSAAIGAAARTLGRELPSYTVTLTDDPTSESPFAGRVARLLHLAHHEVRVESRDLARGFQETVAALGHPIGDPSAILLRLLADAAAEHAYVVFSGDGSEELFGGGLVEGLGRSLRAARAHDRLPRAVRRLVQPALARSQRGRRVSADPDRWGLELTLGGNDLFSTDERAALLTRPDLVRPEIRTTVLAPFYTHLDTDPINGVLNAWMRSRLHESALHRTGRTAAAAGLDARFPLLDNDVVTMAMRLPGSAKVSRGARSLQARWPLQALLSGVLPPSLVNRPKRSMPMLHRWLATSGRLFLEERVTQLLDARHGLFARAPVLALRRDVATRAGAAQRLWTLFLLQAWIDANDIV